jgi:hypothetical protein
MTLNAVIKFAQNTTDRVTRTLGISFTYLLRMELVMTTIGILFIIFAYLLPLIPAILAFRLRSKGERQEAIFFMLVAIYLTIVVGILPYTLTRLVMPIS